MPLHIGLDIERPRYAVAGTIQSLLGQLLHRQAADAGRRLPHRGYLCRQDCLGLRRPRRAEPIGERPLRVRKRNVLHLALIGKHGQRARRHRLDHALADGIQPM